MMTNQETTTDLLDKQHNLLFNAGRSMRYHDKRSAFFDIVDKFLTFITLIFSSATIATLIKDRTISAAILAIISSAASALSLVCGFAIKSRNHFDFKRQWYDLYCDIENTPPTKEALDGFQKRYQNIEREEPAVMIWLNQICYIEQCKAMGRSEKDLQEENISPIHWFYRLTAHFHNFGTNHFKY